MLNASCLYRYVVCKDLLPGHEAVHEYLFAVNEEMMKLKETAKDIQMVKFWYLDLCVYENNINFMYV